MSTTATVAISAGSALAGVALGAGVDYLRDRRRERRDHERSRAALESAKRQVAAELYEIGAAMRVIANEPDEHDVASFRPMLKSRARWEELNSTLAQDPSYEAAHGAYTVSALIERGLDGWERSQRIDEAQSALRHVVKAIREVQPGSSYLERLTRPYDVAVALEQTDHAADAGTSAALEDAIEATWRATQAASADRHSDT